MQEFQSIVPSLNKVLEMVNTEFEHQKLVYMEKGVDHGNICSNILGLTTVIADLKRISQILWNYNREEI